MKHICENCGNEHDGSYGSGRFCSNHCRHVYIGKQTKKHVCNFKNMENRSPYGTWVCPHCSDHPIFNTRQELLDHKHKYHPIESGSSWNKGLTKETSDIVKRHAEKLSNDYKTGKLTSYNKGKHMPEEIKQKVSQSMKKFCKEHPDRVPYVLNHSSKESYPEKYFRELLTKENITGWKQDLSHIGYFLDFGFKDKQIDLEIDGEQHYTDKGMVEHDIIRNKSILDSGWKVIRIRWASWQSMNDIDRKQIIIYIKDILNHPDNYCNFIIIDKPLQFVV